VRALVDAIPRKIKFRQTERGRGRKARRKNKNREEQSERDRGMGGSSYREARLNLSDLRSGCRKYVHAGLADRALGTLDGIARRGTECARAMRDAVISIQLDPTAAADAVNPGCAPC